MLGRDARLLLIVASLAGCEEPEKGDTTLAWRVTSDAVALGSARYDQDDPPSQTVSVLNLDAIPLFVTAGAVEGDGAAMIEVDADNFDDIDPGDVGDVTISLVDDVLLWDGGAFSLTLPLTIAAEVVDGSDTAAPPEWVEESIEIAITFEVDCDLDDDGAEADLTGGTDCDDALAGVGPEVSEVCNGIDDDCDGVEDEEDAADALHWYRDGDEDDYGDRTYLVYACEEPDGFVANDADCDDGNADVYPGAEETCNDLDDDCDESVDEDLECEA